MNEESTRDTWQQGKGRIVEIVGPAGAGKTTLYQALGCRAQAVRLENFPDVRKIADAPFFILNGLQLIPRLLRLSRGDSRQLTRREFAWMTILHGWPALIHNQLNENNKIIVVDQGPVYLLAEMHLFGPEYLRRKDAERLWQDLYSRWSDTLQMVLWLDADNDILLDRIRNRRQDHIMKNQPVTEVYEFLDSYRAEYELIFSALRSRKGNLQVLEFDTWRQKPEEILEELLFELDC